MVKLGDSYLKAGFLTKAENTYLEILRKHPRNIEVLYNLEFIYELLNDLKMAKDILTPLETLGEDIENLRVHIEILSILNSQEISHRDRVEKLSSLISIDFAYRVAIKSLFQLDTNKAWELINMDKINEIIDILWLLPSSNLNLDSNLFK